MNSDEEDDIIKPEKLSIYRKGKEIYDMVIKITELIPENDEYLMEVKACMLSDAAQLTVKVAGAEAAELYDLKMENAAIIRKAARDLMHYLATQPQKCLYLITILKNISNEKQSFSRHLQNPQNTSFNRFFAFAGFFYMPYCPE